MKTAQTVSELIIFAHNINNVQGIKLESLLNELVSKGIAKIDGFIYVHDEYKILN